MPIELIVLMAAIILRLGEWRLHRLNRGFLMEHGAKEVNTKLPALLTYIEWLVIGLMVSERFFAPKFVDHYQMHAAAVLLIVAFAIRLWVRLSLGRMWTLGLIYIPGAEAVDRGPYRYFSHPEYAARFLEFVGLALFLGAYFSFGIYAGLLLILLPRILILERRQLRLLGN